MKTIEINIYKFSELSESAKHNVCERERESWGSLESSFIANDRKDTLQAFCNVFSINYEIRDNYNSAYIKWSLRDDDIDPEEIKGKYLLRFLNAHYYSIRSRKNYFGHKYVDGKFTFLNRESRILWENDHCPLTGICYDCDILRPIYEWYAKPDWQITLYDLIEKCFDRFSKAWDRDDDYAYSDEGIAEMIEANCEDTYYLENGTEYTGELVEECVTI